MKYRHFLMVVVASTLALAACGADDTTPDDPTQVGEGGIESIQQDVGPQMQSTVVQRADGEYMECVDFMGSDNRGYRSSMGFFGMTCDWALEAQGGG